MLKIGTQGIAAMRLGAQEIQKAYLGNAPVFGAGEGPPKLPKGYVQVEYIHFASTSQMKISQAINAATDRFIFRYKPTSATTSERYMLWLQTSLSTSTLYWIQFSATSSKLLYNTAGVMNSTPAASISMTVKEVLLEFDIDFLNKKYHVNNTELVGSRISRDMGTTHRYIGGYNSNYPTCPGDFYGLMQYRSGELIRNYIPCVDPSGEVGAYEMISGEFIKGTGTLTAGPAV